MPALSPTAVSDHDPVETVRAFHRERGDVTADLVAALRGLVARWDQFTSRNGGWGNQEDAYYDIAKHAQKEWDAARAALARVS